MLRTPFERPLVDRSSFLWFIFTTVVVWAIIASAPMVAHAGRYDTVCSGDFCYIAPPRKPNIEVQNKQFAKAALHAVFAQEEKDYPGLAALLGDESTPPVRRAVEDMVALRKSKSNPTAADLEAVIRANKAVYLSQTGIQQWINSFRPPTVTSFSPKEGIVGDAVTIYGKNLKDVTQVRFNWAKVNPKIVSDTEIRVNVPDYIGAISFPLELTSPLGTAKTSTDFKQLTGDCDDRNIPRAFWELKKQRPRGDGKSGQCDPAQYGNYGTYEKLLTILQQRFGYEKREPPKITSVFPTSGPVGTKVRIDGYNFYQLKTIVFGGRPALFTSESEYTAFATVPDGGSGMITLSTLSGSVQWPTAFSVIAPPELTGFSPSELVVGETLRITGKNFSADPIVLIPGAQVFHVLLKSPTEIHVKMIEPGKNLQVGVRTGGGDSMSGGTVTVWTGQCSNADITRAIQELLDHKPYGQGSEGQCDPAKYRGGRWASYEELKFGVRQRYGYKQKPAPTISRIEPSTGVADQWVTIYGTGFDELQSVIFGSNGSWEVQRQSSTQLRAKIPFGAGSGEVVVSTLYGVGRFPNFGIGYPPSINSVEPREALPGVDVTLWGRNFDVVGTVMIANTAVAIKSKTATEMVVTVPKGLEGRVTITATSSRGNATWGPFGIVKAKLVSPTNKVRDLRLELTAPDGRLIASSLLIGNAGAGLSDAQLNQLIGNAGAGLIGNAGAGLTNAVPLTQSAPLSIQDITTLIGNAGAGLSNVTPLIGNAGAGFSQTELTRLIGNAGAGLVGNSGVSLSNVTPLIGNAGAGLIEASVSRWSGLSLATLIGNAGASLAGNAGSTLAGNAGSTLAGNAGSTLAGNAGSTFMPILRADLSLAGNAGSTFSANTGGAFTANTGGAFIANTGGALIGTTGGALASRSVMNLSNKISPYGFQSASSVEVRPTPPIQSTTPAIVPAQPTPLPLALPPAPKPSPPVVKPAAPVPFVAPSVEEPAQQPVSQTPVIEPTPPPPPPPPEPERPQCPSGSTFSPTFGRCIEDVPVQVEQEHPACPDGESWSITLRQCVK